MHILCIFACATNKNSLDCFDKLFRQLIEFSLRFSHIVVACNYIVRRNVAQLKKKDICISVLLEYFNEYNFYTKIKEKIDH